MASNRQLWSFNEHWNDAVKVLNQPIGLQYVWRSTSLVVEYTKSTVTHGLFINEAIAMATIQELANGTDIISLNASIVAEKWNKGAIKPPF